MGAEGLRAASKVAILSANYLARRLDPYFPVLYQGSRGRVAHECVVDLRPMTRATGVTAEDVAKPLAELGVYHTPPRRMPPRAPPVRPRVAGGEAGAGVPRGAGASLPGPAYPRRR